MRKSKLSKEVQKQLISYFLRGESARSATSLVNNGIAGGKVDKSTADYFFHRLRVLIKDNMESSDVGEFEEGYSCPKPATGRVPVIGIYRRDGKIFTRPFPNMPRDESRLDRVVYSEAVGSVIGLSGLEISSTKHFSERCLGSPDGSHSDSSEIDRFWDQIKVWMRKGRGISTEKFPLYVAEWQWRFNTFYTIQQKDLLRWAEEKGLMR